MSTSSNFSNTGNSTPLVTRPMPEPQSRAQCVPALPGPCGSENTWRLQKSLSRGKTCLLETMKVGRKLKCRHVITVPTSHRGLCTTRCQASEPQTHRQNKLVELSSSGQQNMNFTTSEQKVTSIESRCFFPLSFGILTSGQPFHTRGPGVWLCKRWVPEEPRAYYRRLPAFCELLPNCSVHM